MMYGRMEAVAVRGQSRARTAAWEAARERMARLVSLAILGATVGVALAAPLALIH
jgi:hypothetical protein